MRSYRRSPHSEISGALAADPPDVAAHVLGAAEDAREDAEGRARAQIVIRVAGAEHVHREPRVEQELAKVAQLGAVAMPAPGRHAHPAFALESLVNSGKWVLLVKLDKPIEIG